MANNKHKRAQKHKERVFLLVALLIPFALLTLAELGLRIAGYGSDEPLFTSFDPVPGYLRTNDAVAARYFASEATLPTIPLEIFKEAKDKNTVRVVVQGGSSAAGFPYYFGTGLADQLEPRLAALLPDKKVEVIGTAMAAVNSYTLLDLSEEILRLEPDAIAIYAGHNEYYGALGVGSSESLGGSTVLKRIYLGLRPLRIVQALRGLLAGLAGAGSGRKDGDPPSVTMMERMVGDQSIPYQSPDFRAGIEQFDSNLHALLDVYAKRGTPVFIGTLTSNVRDQAPFVDGSAPGTDPDALQAGINQARESLARGDTVLAIESLEQTVERDSVFATARYVLGRTLLARTDQTRARDLLYGAKDRDQLRFRAPEAFNRIIRETARLYPNVHLADVVAAFDAETRDGVADSTLMTEHLHPNVRGYRLLTDAFVDAMVRARLFGLSHKDYARPIPGVTRLDSLLGEIRLRRLKGSWPFKPAGSVASELMDATGGSFEEERALEVFREERGRTEVLEELREYYMAQRRFEDALNAALAISLRFPFMGKPLVDAGDAATAMGKQDEALYYYRASLEREDSAPARRMVGAITLQRGDREDAIVHLRRAVELNSDHPQSLYNLAGALALDGKYQEARALCESLLAKYPNHEAGRKLLGSLP